MRNRLINLHFHKEEISQSISLVKDGRLEFHVYLGDSSSEAVLRSRTRVDDGVRHRVVVSKHKVRANKDGKSRVSRDIGKSSISRAESPLDFQVRHFDSQLSAVVTLNLSQRKI